MISSYVAIRSCRASSGSAEVLHAYTRNSRHFDPHFEEVRGGVEPWWMARWKARAEFSLSVIELLFTARAMLALQALY